MMIKFDEIIRDKEYRERVIKYFRLPIRLSVSLEKFISDLEFMKLSRIEDYENMVRLTEHDFNKEAREQGTNKPDFTMEHALGPIMKNIEGSDEWKLFIKKDYSSVLSNFDGVTSTHGFYIKENDGKHFISIDLKAANWQSLQSIVGFKDSYEDMIVKYTDNLIPPISKTFRTKITGILGAKKIMNYNQKILLDNRHAILDIIFNETGSDLRDYDIAAFYADEFIIEIDKSMIDRFNSLDINDLEERILEGTGVSIHFRPFTLKWLGIAKGCAKLNMNYYEILNISKDILLIMNKLKYGVKPNDIDFANIKLGGLSREEFINKLDNVNNELYYN